jgi:hypothetical protein
MRDFAQPRLRQEPFARAPGAAILDDVTDPGGPLCPRPAFVADSDPAVRFGCVVLVELSSNVQTLR